MAVAVAKLKRLSSSLGGSDGSANRDNAAATRSGELLARYFNSCSKLDAFAALQ
jgi:hypothetical protein